MYILEWLGTDFLRIGFGIESCHSQMVGPRGSFGKPAYSTYVLVYVNITCIHSPLLVPGTSEGPGGVLVCSENWVTWKNQNYDDVRVPIPRRRSQDDDPSRGLMITSYYVHKMKVSLP